MKKRILLVLLAVIAIPAIYFAFFSAPKPARVLVFSKTAGYRHASIPNGQAAIKVLGEANNFVPDTTEDAGMFRESVLKNYHAVIFLNTTLDVLDDVQQMAFQRFIQAGGGFVGVHSAADTEYDWPWYGDLVGAYFVSHPKIQEAEINVLNKKHKATKALPMGWKRIDEWYNYKNVSKDINVLLKMNEASYEGGTMGGDHPISWYQEFDGGRAFYTGLGHTPESYKEPLFLEHLLGGIEYALGEKKNVDYTRPTVVPEENRFHEKVLDQGLYEPMELEILPNGNILYIQRLGGIFLYDVGADSTREVTTLDIYHGHEDGLLGMALDPKFSQNNWIYLYYSPPGETPLNHLSRFVFKDEKLDLASEKVLLKIPTQRDECCHSAGSVEFGPDGNLFLSLGDNTNPFESDGYSPSDDQPGRKPFDARRTSANTMDLRGKIIRIKPLDNGTYAIPEGNLFSDPLVGLPEIYVMGCRNPFRISIDSRTKFLYWGEVGPDAGVDSMNRGPKGHDEVNQAKKAGFYGWPLFVGDNKPYHAYDFATKVSGSTFDPARPINTSVNNTGSKVLPPAQKAFIWYPYDESKEFPLVETGGRNAMAGPVYHHEDFPDNPQRYPSYFNNKLFTYDWMRGWVMVNTLDENGDLVRMERFLPSKKFSNPVDMMFGPEGALYILEYGKIWNSRNPDARLTKLTYNPGNRKPVPVITADKTIGAVPLTVNFSAVNSIDYDGDSLTYQWWFDSPSPQSKAIAQTHTFSKPGKYDVVLKVKDSEGNVSSSQMEILVGNEVPEVKFQLSGNQTFYWDRGNNRTYSIMVADQEDGSLENGKISSETVNVTIDYLENGVDITEVSQGHKALAEASMAHLGKELMNQSDCYSCHQNTEKSIGPAFSEVSKKYGASNKNLNYLTEKIIHGGGGVWGETAMAAHPQLSSSQVNQMVRYILSLSGDKSLIKRLPVSGKFTPRAHIGNGTEGSYLFLASYTDKGAPGATPLTGQQLVTLRHPLVQAEDFDVSSRLDTKELPRPADQKDAPKVEVVICKKDQYFGFKDIDLTDVKSVKVFFITEAKEGVVPTIEMRVGSPNGKVIGAQGLPAFGGIASARFSLTGEIAGRQDIYFTISLKEGDATCLIDAILFGNGGLL